MAINERSTLRDIASETEYLGRLAKWLLVTHEDWHRDQPLDAVLMHGAVQPAIKGLAGMEALDAAGVETMMDYYTDAEKRAQPDKNMTKLLYAPGKPGAPFVVVCPGGAYHDVWTISEGVSALAALSQMGYHTFSLVYRVHEDGLMPKPVDDLAAAIRYIRSNAARLGLNGDDYAVLGYSAGGHLTAEWGSDNHGFSAYGLPKPGALLMGYPSSSTLNFVDDIASGTGDEEFPSDGDSYLTAFYTGERTRDKLAEYSVELHAGADYPPSYIVHSKDDPNVHYQTSVLLKQSLDRAGVPSKLETVDGCGHGFAVGLGTPAQGWLDRAVEFWRAQK